MQLTNQELKFILDEVQLIEIETDSSMHRECKEINIAPDLYIYYEAVIVTSQPECFIEDGRLRFATKFLHELEMLSIIWEGEDISTDEQKDIIAIALEDKITII